MGINIYPTVKKEIRHYFPPPFSILAVSVISLFDRIKESSQGEEGYDVPGETPTYSVLFSMGIPQLSAFITFVLLGCWGDAVNGVVQVHFQLLKAGTALCELCHSPWSCVHCWRTLFCSTIYLKTMAKADSPKSEGTWSRSEGSIFYLELGCQLS